MGELCCAFECQNFIERIDHYFIDGDTLVHEAIDERRIGAVFEQAPYEIRE